MILYYSISTALPEGGGTNPWLALGLLLISVILWATLLNKYFRKWVLSVFRTKSGIERLLLNGARREATITGVKRLAPAAPGVETVEVQFEMENFAGTMIMEKLQINDSKPGEKRYEAGKILKLRVDETLKTRPFLIPESTILNYKRPQVVLLFCGWLLVLLAVAGYYIFSYSYESNGAGWRFLSFWHPLVLCPVILLLYREGFSAILGKFLGDPEEALRLKYYGLKATAKVISASQTGTYINEQPQVRFDLEYQDVRGQSHRVSVKKIISLLKLDVTRQEDIEIFYLEDDPQKIAFASDFTS